MSLELFANDKYFILKLLKENQITIKDETYISLSQQEIADLAHKSKLKTNRILNELIEAGFLTSTIRGKYYLTDKAYKAIDTLETTEI